MLENKEKEKDPGALGLMPDPPPYPDDRNPFRAGQYPSVTMRGKGVAELVGEVQFEPMAGKFKVMVNSEDAQILWDGLSSSEEDEEAALGTRRRLVFGEVYIGKPRAGKRISLPDMGATLSQTKVSKEANGPWKQHGKVRGNSGSDARQPRQAH
ncbi:hypothetical protein AAFF_G00412360 [Aldrovandia affinis]|uniref:Uncharacterized protein n=1 Tax=Aldrovandia affinis TaxID=143900 RepID=A0AAD7R3G2_9TELE|nr:hypothetical protein AAFF_G00412360 [Aldrovandia affinis]